MVRQAWIHDAFTGAPLMPVYPTAARWTMRLKGSESASATFNLNDDLMGQLPQPLLADLFRENARMLMIRDGSAVEFYGPIVKVVDDPLTGVMQVECKGERDKAANRYTFPANDLNAAPLVIASRSHSGAIRAILQRFMLWSAEWHLPIDLPVDSSGVYSRTVYGWEAQTISQLIAGVEAEGSEVWLRPYLAEDGSGRFQPRVASQITLGSYTDIMSAAPQSPLLKLQRSSDGANQATGVVVLGRGSERDTKSAYAGFMAGPVIPVSDVVLTKKDIANTASLARIAQAELAKRRYPNQQWSMEFSTEKVSVGRLLPGSLIRLDVRNDRLKPDGQYLLRVIALSGTWGSTQVSPEVQAYG